MNPNSKKTIAAIKRARTGRLAKLVARAYMLHRKNDEELMYNLICEEFVALGGVYIKFLQGVLLRSEVMKRWHNPAKLDIFENLDSEPINIGTLLQHELNKNKLSQIASIQPVPFAAGSFGQVYYGTHRNGKPIIVKVLRPMVRELLKYDLKLLGTFSKTFFSKLYPNIQINLNEAINEFKQATLRETDYKGEAEFAYEMFTAYHGSETFIIPETYIDLCTENIIVQEYIDGLSVAQVVKMQEQGADPVAYVKEVTGSDLDEQLRILGFESLFGVFKLNRIQGDPHPGNIRLMSDNRVGLIDFGISAHSPKDRSAFFGLIEEYANLYHGQQSVASLFEMFMRFFVSDLYKALKKLSGFAKDRSTKQEVVKAGEEKAEDLTREVGKVAQDLFQRLAGTPDLRPMLEDGSILKVISKTVNKQNRFGLVMKLEATEILRAAQTYMTLVESLGRSKKVLPRVFGDVVVAVREKYPELLMPNDDSMSMSQALETVGNWLERVADRDPVLFKELASRIHGKKNATVKEVKESTNA